MVAAVPPFAHAIAKGALCYERDLAPTVFVCGDDIAAKRLVEALVRELGAQPVDAGPLRAARLVEPAMMLTVSIAYSGVPRDVGLRLLERPSVASEHERSTCDGPSPPPANPVMNHVEECE